MPKRTSVPQGEPLEAVTLEDALLWLSVPRNLGVDPKTSEEVIAMTGRYGPYIKSGAETRSLGDLDDVYTIQLPRGLELLAQPKSFRRRGGSKVLKDLGTSPDGRSVRILDGRWGPYATDGETNASLPREADPEQVSIEAALDLIAERVSAPKRARKTARKSPRKAAKKKRTRKTTNKAD